MGWLMNKVAKRLDDKTHSTTFAEALQGAETGESVAVIITRDGVAHDVDRQTAAPPVVDSAEQLQRLGGLHTRGVLTDAEFEAQKQQITGG